MSDADRTGLQPRMDSKQKSLDSSVQKVKEQSQADRRNVRDRIVEQMASIVVSMQKKAVGRDSEMQAGRRTGSWQVLARQPRHLVVGS